MGMLPSRGTWARVRADEVVRLRPGPDDLKVLRAFAEMHAPHHARLLQLQHQAIEGHRVEFLQAGQVCPVGDGGRCRMRGHCVNQAAQGGGAPDPALMKPT